MPVLTFYFCTSISDNTRYSEMNPAERKKHTKYIQIKISSEKKDQLNMRVWQPESIQ